MTRQLALFFLFLALTVKGATADDRLVFRGVSYPLQRTESAQGLFFLLPENVRQLLPQSGSFFLILGPLHQGRWRLTQASPRTHRVTPIPEFLNQNAYFAVPFLERAQFFELRGLAPYPENLDFVISQELPQGQNFPLVVVTEKETLFYPPRQERIKDSKRLSYNFRWQAEGPVKIEIQGETASLNFESTNTSPSLWTYFPSLWEMEAQKISFQGKDFQMQKAGITRTADKAPLFTDAASFLQTPERNWRDPQREFFQWAEHPQIFVLVSKDYATQDNYFKRLAFFVEKPGFRGHLSTDEELAELHAWNAHDYAPADLAAFFTLAQNTGFVLNPQEVELRELLVLCGVLSKEDGGWRPGKGALLGISLESEPALREKLFTHEAFHGLYFISEDFHTQVLQIWKELSPLAKTTFTTYLGKLSYDPQYKALMVNEFQAYCLQQATPDWKNFFAAKVILQGGPQLPHNETESLIDEYIKAAEELNQTVKSLFQVQAGRVIAVKKVKG